jgi:hypothetical protein
MISYSALNNYGKSSLPSNDGWGQLNILKDPPKSIHTRRVDKVGETSSITEMVDESGNRSCEAISLYARGVNPSVSVSYSNDGNNGGQRVGGNITTQGCPTTQAFSPYTIIKDGAFRPPIRRQEDLLPYSRRPRVFFKQDTNPSLPDYSKKMLTCGEAKDYKAVKTETLRASIRPTVRYKMNTAIQEPFEIKYSIQPVLNISATSGTRTRDITSQFVKTPTKEIDTNNMHAYAQSNKNQDRYINNSTFKTDKYIQESNVHSAETNKNQDRYVNNSILKTDKYIQESNVHSAETNRNRDIYVNDSNFSTVKYIQNSNTHSAQTNKRQNRHVNNSNFKTDNYIQETTAQSAETNPSSSKHVTSIEDILDLSDLPTKNIKNISYSTAISGNEKNNLEHKDIELRRRVPEHSATTNNGRNIHKTVLADNEIKLHRNKPMASMISNPVKKADVENNSREFKLPPKIQPGGFSGEGYKPTMDRIHNVGNIGETEKTKMAKNVMSQHQARYLR